MNRIACVAHLQFAGREVRFQKPLAIKPLAFDARHAIE